MEKLTALLDKIISLKPATLIFLSCTAAMVVASLALYVAIIALKVGGAS